MTRPSCESFSSCSSTRSAVIRSDTSKTAPTRLLLVSSGLKSRKVVGLRT